MLFVFANVFVGMLNCLCPYVLREFVFARVFCVLACMC